MLRSGLLWEELGYELELGQNYLNSTATVGCCQLSGYIPLNYINVT